MDLKQNPFSFYDFLGYFTPGAIFLYAALVVYGHAIAPTEPLSVLEKTFESGNGELYVFRTSRISSRSFPKLSVVGHG
jgi:hypothetical protein